MTTPNDYERAIALDLGMRDMEITRLKLQVADLERQLAKAVAAKASAVVPIETKPVTATNGASAH